MPFQAGLGAPLDISDPVPIRIVKVVTSKTGSPVAGVQFNIVDEDRETVLWAGITDKNGIAIMPVKFNLPTVSEEPHANFIRTMLLPVGYANPTPRTYQTNVGYSEPKVDATKIATLYPDTSKAKPDFVVNVDDVSTPITRTQLTYDQANAKGMTSSASGTTQIAGSIAFQIRLQDGTVAKPDRNTPYSFMFTPIYPLMIATPVAVSSGTLDIDPNGVIWIWTAYPTIGSLSLTPYFGGRPFPAGFGSSKPEWGISRVLVTTPPYPYVYELKNAPDGGLMSAGKITVEELGAAGVKPDGKQGPVSPTLLPPPPPPAGPDKNTFFYIMVAVVAIGATFAYFRLKED